jgi:tetratricopeptide (TPR) repeat protein
MLAFTGSRLRSWIGLPVVCACTLWFLSRGIPTLTSNLALVALLDHFTTLPSPQPGEVLGLDDRFISLPSHAESDLLPLVDRVRSRTTRGALLALSGQLAPAECLLGAGMPGDVLARFWLGFVYGQQHRPEAAIESLNAVLGVDEYFAQAGFREQQLGRYDRATSLLEAAAALDCGTIRERSLVYDYLTKNAYNYNGDWDRAVYWAERWTRATPRSTDSYIWLAALYLWHGQPEEAYQALRRGAPYGVCHHRFYAGQMGQIHQSRGQWNLAIEAYLEAWVYNQHDPNVAADIAWYLGFALFHEGHWEEAQPYLEFVVHNGRSSLQQQAADTLAEMRDGGMP